MNRFVLPTESWLLMSFVLAAACSDGGRHQPGQTGSGEISGESVGGHGVGGAGGAPVPGSDGGSGGRDGGSGTCGGLAVGGVGVSPVGGFGGSDVASGGVTGSAGSGTCGFLRFLALGDDISIGGMSADGSVVVGTSGTTLLTAFRWTLKTGVTTLPNLPATDSCTATALSSDGTYAVGTCTSAVNSSFAVRWAGTSTPVDLGLPAGYVSAYANAVNSSGTVVTGSAYDGTTETASIWTVGKAPEAIGTNADTGYSYGFGVAGSGSNVTVVGRYYSVGAFKWTAASGMALLPFFPGVADDDAATGAYAISTDGTQIVGALPTSSGDSAAFWTESLSGTDVVNLAGEALYNSSAAAISGDGKTIVGGSASGAWIWTNGTIRLIAPILATYNIDLSGYFLQSAVAVSANGTIIAGNASLTSTGANVGWIATLD